MPPGFFFGAMSPNSWFAAERIGGLPPDAEWRPVFAGGLFTAQGRVSWGLTDPRAARAAGIADCEARARAHGLGTIRWPDPWPTSDLLITRAMVSVQPRGHLKRFALAAMRMAFRDGVDLGEPGAVRAVARRAGLDGDGVAAEVHRPEVKADLRAATDEAVAVEVFGVPSVQIGDALFWGDDRLAAAAPPPPRVPDLDARRPGDESRLRRRSCE